MKENKREEVIRMLPDWMQETFEKEMTACCEKVERVVTKKQWAEHDKAISPYNEEE